MIDYETIDRDRVTRWNPTASAVQYALTLLNYETDADMALIPMYQPGKQYGIWEYGQEVCTVHGVIFLAVNSFDSDSLIPSMSWARDAASQMARHAMGDREGTVAYAVVRRDSDRTPVFEDLI